MLIDSYVNEIGKRIKGKTVIDIGCCASTSKNLLKRHFLYMKTANTIIGIDYNKTLIEEAKNRLNYEVHYCDVSQKSSIENIYNKFGKFDTVVCTDVIEHVGNMTNFLDNINYLMTDNATLHLTTPNMRSPRWLNMFIAGKIKVNKDHICWFDIFTLTILLKRSGLVVDEIMYHAQETADIRKLGLQPKDWMSRRLYVTIKKG